MSLASVALARKAALWARISCARDTRRPADTPWITSDTVDCTHEAWSVQVQAQHNQTANRSHKQGTTSLIQTGTTHLHSTPIHQNGTHRDATLGCQHASHTGTGINHCGHVCGQTIARALIFAAQHLKHQRERFHKLW